MGRERLFITRWRVGYRPNFVKRLDSSFLELVMLGMLCMLETFGMLGVVGMVNILCMLVKK